MDFSMRLVQELAKNSNGHGEKYISDFLPYFDNSLLRNAMILQRGFLFHA